MSNQSPKEQKPTKVTQKYKAQIFGHNPPIGLSFKLE